MATEPTTTKQYSTNCQTMKSDDHKEEVKKERTHCFVLYDSQNFIFSSEYC